MGVASVAMELGLGLELGTNQGVPGEFLSAEVGDKVVEGIQAGLEEGEKWVVAQEAHGQHSPLLDADGVGLFHHLAQLSFGELSLHQRVEQVGQREAHAVRMGVGLRVSQHEDVGTGLGEVFAAAVRLAEVGDVEREFEIWMVVARKSP